MIKKLFTHSFLYSIAPQIPKIVSLLLMPIITQHVTALDYGIYGIITSYLYFISSLKDLGLGVVFVNTFYKNPSRWKLIWRMLYGHLLIWGVVYLFLFLILLYIAIPREEINNYWTIALLIGIPAIFFENSNTLGNYYFRFSQKPIRIAIVTIISGVTSICITYYSIVILEIGYLGWFLSSFISSFIVFLCYIYPVYFKLKLFPIIRFRKKFILPFLKVSLPMIPHNYASYLLSSSDRVVMNLYKVDVRQIGFYNIAYLFGNYFDAVGEAIGMAVGPFYTKLYTSKSDQALKDEKYLTFFLMTCFLVGTFLVSLWLKEIFLMMIHNEELQSAYGLGIIIIMGYAYRPLYWSAGIKLSIFEKTSILWKISFVAGLINVVINIIFVPYYGIYASAVCTLLSLLYLGCAGYYFKSYRNMEGENHYPLLWALGIIVLTIASYYLKDVHYLNKIIISAGVLSLLAIGIRRYYGILKVIDV